MFTGLELLILASVLPCSNHSHVAAAQKWDGLKVTWGPTLDPPFFDSMPRTESEAKRMGFKKIGSCNPQAKWRGSRYVKDDDYAVTLLYDVAGHIAGIQTSVPKHLPNGFPWKEIQPPFIEDGRRFVSTVYFVNPAIICKRGRSRAQFQNEGTGTVLYIQNSSVPEDSVRVPDREVDIQGTEWTKGMCFPRRMGQHYSYRTSLNMKCEELFPMCVIYNKGQLNAFGWALQNDLPSPRYEHPVQATFALFMNPVPKCLYSAGTLSIFHVFMTSDVSANTC
ncbi:uncharacterized protein LOC131943653 [Physella acuta]|uniref:uncharacterized protein LOC131943653 n=1 Tax=Physella acuta TaxID=109671 RepID=UPI0027DAC94F|nr:uncharacterized protein LOC131943653 [Physella acuta]